MKSCKNSVSFLQMSFLNIARSKAIKFTEGVEHIAIKKVKQTNVGFLAIGDEILSGKIQDLNVHYLANAVFKRGGKLSSVEFVPDEEDRIIESVQRLSSRCDVVFTSGGIGPTHDDITYESLAKAFSRKLEYDIGTIERMNASLQKRNQEFNEARARMTLLPYPSTILIPPGGRLWVPVVALENVFILPGIPKLFNVLCDFVVDSCDIIYGEDILTVSFYTKWKEGDLANMLTNLAKDYEGVVSIGSYPQAFMTSNACVKLTFTGTDVSKVEECAQKAKELFSGYDLFRSKL